MRALFFRFLVIASIAAASFFLLTYNELWPSIRIPDLPASVQWTKTWSPSGSASDDFADPDVIGDNEDLGFAPTESSTTISSALPTHSSISSEAELYTNDSKISTINEYTVAELVNSTTSSKLWNRTQRLVVAKLRDDDNLWIDFELGDLIEPNGPLSTAIYVVNDKEAQYHPPENKGHEAIVYLTYIIDFYDDLPDVSLFMHGHGVAWHNNDLLNLSSALMVRHLNLEKVEREGYMNLRCHWSPGCPDWLHPNEVEYDGNKQEQLLFAPAWKQLFPEAPVPDVLSQPCCSQFAVTRARIRETPRERFVAMRDWILGTDLADEDSGRIFEYCWQYLFHHTTSFCPEPRICYCDGYGVCFETQQDWDDYFEVQDRHGEEMDAWWKWNERTDLYHKQRDPNRSPDDVKEDEEQVDELPPPEEGERLMAKAEEFEREMTRRKNIALALGANPAERQRVLKKTWEQVTALE